MAPKAEKFAWSEAYTMIIVPGHNKKFTNILKVLKKNKAHDFG